MRRQNLEHVSVPPAPVSDLDTTILERMKADHHHPPAWRQQRGSSFEHLLQFRDLVVNRNPNRLKGLGRRMNAPPMLSRDGAFHRRRQLRRASDRPPPNNGSSDSSAPPFLTIMKNQIGKPFLVIGVDDPIGSQSLALIDSHVHYFGYEGELYLNHGVTTVMSLGGIPEWDQTQAEAIARGDVVGPRMFTAGNPLGSPPGAPIGMPTLGMPHWLPVNDRQEAAQVVGMLLDKGVDYIKVYRGVPNAEVAKVMADLTHQAGKRVVAHLGPNFDARQAAVAGIDMLAHASGVVDATTQDPERQRQAGEMRLEGARASLMQRELFSDLIDLLIREEVYLETSMATNAFKGFHPLSARFLMETALLLSSNDLLYVTDYQRRRWFRLQNFASPVDEITQRAVQEGYRNFTLFLRRFVEAGGRLLVGSDAEGLVPPGLGLHQELELVVDAGIGANWAEAH